MKEIILITGFNGSLASYLSNTIDYTKYEVRWLTTKKNICSSNIYYWNFQEDYIDPLAIKNVSHIIHLAGFNISHSWSKKNKQLMSDSRIKTSELLYKKCQTHKLKLKTFISASAMGYYGFYQKGIKTEQDKPANDWMSKLCVNWEKNADNFQQIGARVCKLRLSLILDKKSDIIQKTFLGFKFRIGVIFGNGKQAFPWIHIKDVARFIKYCLENETVKGVFNVSTTQHISYYDFIKSIQKHKFPKSILINIPKIIVSLIMPRQKALIFNNMKICASKMEKTEFQWEYENIDKMVKEGL